MLEIRSAKYLHERIYITALVFVRIKNGENTDFFF